MSWSEEKEKAYLKIKFARSTQQRPRKALLEFARKLDSDEFNCTVSERLLNRQSVAATLGRRGDNVNGAIAAFRHENAPHSAASQQFDSPHLGLTELEKQARRLYLQQRCNAQHKRANLVRKKHRQRKNMEPKPRQAGTERARSDSIATLTRMPFSKSNRLTSKSSKHRRTSSTLKCLSKSSKNSPETIDENAPQTHSQNSHGLTNSENVGTSNTGENRMKQMVRPFFPKRPTGRNIAKRDARHVIHSDRMSQNTKAMTTGEDMLKASKGPQLGPSNLKESNSIFLTQTTETQSGVSNQSLGQHTEQLQPNSQGSQLQNLQLERQLRSKIQESTTQKLQHESRSTQQLHPKSRQFKKCDRVHSLNVHNRATSNKETHRRAPSHPPKELTTILANSYLNNALRMIAQRDPFEAQADFACVKEIDSIPSICVDNIQKKQLIRLGSVYNKINVGLPRIHRAYTRAIRTKKNSVKIAKRMLERSQQMAEQPET